MLTFLCIKESHNLFLMMVMVKRLEAGAGLEVHF
jgi:hypothetical protein